MPRLVRQGAVLLGMGLTTSTTLMTTLAGGAEARAAGRASQMSGTGVVSPGGRAVVRLTLHLATDTCRLEASSGQHWRTLSAVNPERANLEWSWRVPADARTTTWHLQAICESEHWSSALRVRGRSHRPSARASRRLGEVSRIRSGTARSRWLVRRKRSANGRTSAKPAAASVALLRDFLA
jgi:hypothetical protein